jgi:hypothetical protein
MADPFDRARFAVSVSRRLEGISGRRAVEVWPTLNTAMISRAKRGDNLTIGTFLVVCRALRLRPFDYLIEGVKRRRVTRKTLLAQTVTARVPCETRNQGGVR